MATSYSQLVDSGGKIINLFSGRQYATNAELAADLGIQPHEIQWGNIRKEFQPAVVQQPAIPAFQPTVASEPTPAFTPAVPLTELQQQTAQARQNIQGIGVQPTTLTPDILTQGSPQEIKQIPPQITPDISGAAASAAGVTTTPTAKMFEAKIAEIQKAQQELAPSGLKALLGELGTKPAALNMEEITKQAFTALGLPADFTKTQFAFMQTASAEINSLNTELANVTKQEQISLQNIGGQAIPMENISRQQSEVQRKFAIEKSGIAAQMQAKSAYIESLRGNFSLVTQLVDKAVTLATHAKTQEIADYKWMVDNYQSEFNKLSTREQKLYDDLITALQAEAKATQEDLRWKANAYLNAKIAPPDMKTLGEMSAQDVINHIAQNTSTQNLFVENVGGFQVLRDQTGKVISTKAPPAPITPGITSAVAKETENVLAQGLSASVITNTGKLTEGSRDKILNAGVPISVLDFIWNSIKAGKSLDTIRSELTELQRKAGSPDPREAAFGSLDAFMRALQGGGTIANPFK